ncbi:MAG: hypothetical protein Q9159_003868 [Coniocarpon cinnabarinum]
MSGNNTSTDIWIAGAFAAFSVDLLVYPLDTLKTRIQSPEYDQRYVDTATGTVRKAVLFRGLYQGMSSVILATLPSSGAFFTTYEHAKTLLSKLPIPTPIAHSGASALAECVSCAILTPAEVIKQNAQMVSRRSIQESHHSATRQTLEKFRRNPLALWRGYGALTTRNLPFTALQFPLYEKAKSSLSAWNRRRKRRREQDPVPLWEHGLTTAGAAGSAGAFSAVLTTPIDVVKTRIMLAAAQGFANQDVGGRVGSAIAEGRAADAVDVMKEEVTKATKTRGNATANPMQPQHYPQRGPDGAQQNLASHEARPKTSSLSIARGIIQEQGWRGLWRGGALRGTWTMLGSGLYLGVYESGRAWLERNREARGEL